MIAKIEISKKNSNGEVVTLDFKSTEIKLHGIIFKYNENKENLMTQFNNYLNEIVKYPKILDCIYFRIIKSSQVDCMEFSKVGRFFDANFELSDTKYQLEMKDNKLPKINFDMITKDPEFIESLSEITKFFPYIKNNKEPIKNMVLSIFELEQESEKLIKPFQLTAWDKFWVENSLSNDKKGVKKDQVRKWVTEALCFPLIQIIIDPILASHSQVAIEKFKLTAKHDEELKLLMRKQAEELELLMLKQAKEINVIDGEYCNYTEITKGSSTADSHVATIVKTKNSFFSKSYPSNGKTNSSDEHSKHL